MKPNLPKWRKRLNVKQFYKIFLGINNLVSLMDQNQNRKSFFEQQAKALTRFPNFRSSNCPSKVEQFGEIQECCICMEVFNITLSTDILRKNRK